MLKEQELLNALKTIAAIPLWGEPITNPAHGDKNELAEIGEYDLQADTYEPCRDAESSWLQHAVETAREALKEMPGRALITAATPWTRSERVGEMLDPAASRQPGFFAHSRCGPRADFVFQIRERRSLRGHGRTI